jgi:hypothetical protein
MNNRPTETNKPPADASALTTAASSTVDDDLEAIAAGGTDATNQVAEGNHRDQNTVQTKAGPTSTDKADETRTVRVHELINTESESAVKGKYVRWAKDNRKSSLKEPPPTGTTATRPTISTGTLQDKDNATTAVMCNNGTGGTVCTGTQGEPPLDQRPSPRTMEAATVVAGMSQGSRANDNNSSMELNSPKHPEEDTGIASRTRSRNVGAGGGAEEREEASLRTSTSTSTTTKKNNTVGGSRRRNFARERRMGQLSAEQARKAQKAKEQATLEEQKERERAKSAMGPELAPETTVCAQSGTNTQRMSNASCSTTSTEDFDSPKKKRTATAGASSSGTSDSEEGDDSGKLMYYGTLCIPIVYLTTVLTIPLDSFDLNKFSGRPKLPTTTRERQ